jgi:autotransporter-associated beta strand protein
MKPKSNPFVAILRSPSLAIPAVLALAGLSSQSARAVDRTWDFGAGTSDWNTLLNWSGDAFANGDNALINTSTGFYPIITANSNFKPADVIIGTTSGQTGRIDQQAGLLQLNVIGANGNWFFTGRNGSTGTYNLANTSLTGQGNLTTYGQGTGSLTVGKLFAGGAYYNAGGTGTININTTGTVSAQSTQNFSGQGSSSIVIGFGGGNGTMNVDSGTVNAAGLTDIADGTANTQATVGTLNLGTGAVFNSEGDFRMASRGSSSAQANLNLNGGTLNVASTVKRWMIIGRIDAGNSTINVNSGNLNLNTNTDIRINQTSNTGNRTISLNGGAITSYSDNHATANGAGVLDLMQAGGGGTSTFHLNGGTLTIRQVMTNNDGGTAVFNFNGGTLKATGTDANFVNLGGAAQRANVRDGGAVINSNGYNVTITQALLHSNILTNNPVSGTPDAAIDGGLTKSGSGILTLSAANTYTGATSINGGILTLGATGSVNNSSGIIINGSGAKFLQTSSTASTPAITLTNGTLDGTGTVGAVTVGAGTGGVVANGNGGTGVLTLGSLAFSGAGGLSLNLANDTAGGLAVTGAVTTGANNTVTVNTLNLLTLGTTYNLVSASDFSGSDLSDYVYGGNTARKLGTFGYSGGFLNLTVNGDTPKWTGGDNGNWVVGSTGGNSNWKLVNANTATDYIANDDVLFDDSATGSTSINISGGSVNPNSVIFNNGSLTYSIGGSSIGDGSAPTSLVKNGTAKVTLTNTNTYTGLTTINAGTLELGDGTTDGSIAGTASVTNNATLAYNLAGNQAVAYAISGTGAVTKSGVGTLTMGSQAYSGGTTVNAGTLKLTSTTGIANNGTFNLGGGTLQVDLGAGNNFNYAPAINLTANSTIGNAAAGSTANLNGQINYSGNLNGNGNALNIANTGLARLYMNGTLTNVSQINVQSGAMGFDINAPANRGTAPVVVSNGAALWFAGINANPVTNNLTFNGGNGINNGGALYYEGGSATPAALTGNITLAGGNTGIGTAYAADAITLNGNITGVGALTQVKGNAILSGASDYSGGTTIASGAMTANSNSALGTGAVSISSVSGAQLKLGSGVNVGNALTINGGGVVAQGVLYSATGDATYSGAITITGVQTAGGHFASNTGTLNLTGPITSSVPVTIRNGTVALSNTGSGYSALAVQQGTAKLGASNAIPVAATVDLGLSGAATLDLAGYNQTLAGITKNANGATVTNSGTSDSTLTTTGTSTFGGVIQDGATNKTSLSVTGGLLTLAGNNTYTGDTTVSAGTLFISGFLGNTAVTVGSGATIGGTGSIGGSLNLDAGSTLDTTSGTLTVAGLVSFDSFGFGNLVGFDVHTADVGTYTLMSGSNFNFTNVSNFGLENALDLGGGKSAYFENGSLQVVVIPEPAAALLGGLGMLVLLRRRRR